LFLFSKSRIFFGKDILDGTQQQINHFDSSGKSIIMILSPLLSPLTNKSLQSTELQALKFYVVGVAGFLYMSILSVFNVLFASTFVSTKRKTPESQRLQGSLSSGGSVAQLKPRECHMGGLY